MVMITYISGLLLATVAITTAYELEKLVVPTCGVILDKRITRICPQGVSKECHLKKKCCDNSCSDADIKACCVPFNPVLAKRAPTCGKPLATRVHTICPQGISEGCNIVDLCCKESCTDAQIKACCNNAHGFLKKIKLAKGGHKKVNHVEHGHNKEKHVHVIYY